MLASTRRTRLAAPGMLLALLTPVALVALVAPVAPVVIGGCGGAVTTAAGDLAVAPADAGAPDLAASPVTGPDLLSQTGLYSDLAARTLAPGVFRYTTRFTVWTDGTAGDSFLLLPPGGTIDTSDMDRWQFPIGTKSWREVKLGEKLLETRYFHKQREGAGGWFEMGYAWKSDGSDATAARTGARNVLGTTYSILRPDECASCHDHVRDGLIGASAVQLGRTGGHGPLSQLASLGLLSAPPAGEFQVPGNALEQAALGYLHGNCGYCHSKDSLLKNTLAMDLDLRVGDRVIADTAVYRTSMNAPMFHPMPPDITLCIVPGEPMKSQLWMRMAVRDNWAMPNLDTQVPDDAGLDVVKRWIEALPR